MRALDAPARERAVSEVGRVDVAATEALLTAAPMGERWLAQLAAHVDRADGPETAASAVDAWAAGLEGDDAFAGLLYRTSLQTFLAGQLMVRSIELADEAGDGEPGTVTLVSRSLHTGRRDFAASFLALPFEEALAFFRSKRLMSEAEFDALTDRYKSGGFIARQLASARLQDVARGAIEQLLAQGLTLPEVVAEIRRAERREVLALGIAPAAPHYLDTVVRTNVATAYGAGRWQAMEDPQVKALRPYRQFWTAGDQRVRPGHRSLHGLVFAADSELASRYAPPLSFNCRCSQTTLSQRQLEARGLVVTSDRVAGIEAEDFWQGTPGLLTEADL